MGPGGPETSQGASRGSFPVTSAASPEDNSCESFNNSIAFLWLAERRLMACLRASGSPSAVPGRDASCSSAAPTLGEVID